MTQYIDIAVNLLSDRLKHDIDTIINDAAKHHVSPLIVIGSDLDESSDSISLCQQYPQQLYCTTGVHPHHASSWDQHSKTRLTQLAQQDTVVAIGECGLDYVKVKDQNTQRFMFDEQISLATRFDLPLIIHSVQATEDVTDLLRSHSKSRGVIHAYSGSIQQAENLLKINFSFGFGNALTNPQAYKLHDIVKFLPIESIVIETDDHKNPDELIQVAERVARIKKLTVDQVIDQCDQNTRNIFNID